MMLSAINLDALLRFWMNSVVGNGFKNEGGGHQ